MSERQGTPISWMKIQREAKSVSHQHRGDPEFMFTNNFPDITYTEKMAGNNYA